MYLAHSFMSDEKRQKHVGTAINQISKVFRRMTCKPKKKTKTVQNVHQICTDTLI